MNAQPERRWLPATMAVLLLAGIFTPLAVFGQATSQEQSQLAALVGAAESSGAYATSTVDYAAASGLSVGAAQAQLSQGNSLLATAQTDLQSGTGLGAGIQAAQGAMSAYEAAATSASVALSGAGLAASVDYYAALSAVAEVNETVGVIASVQAQACDSVGAAASGTQHAQACAQVDAQLVSARTYLGQAASLLAQSSGHATASADVPQILVLVGQARTDVEACQALLLSIASYSYSQRSEAYLSEVIDPLYANANATIRAEESVMAELASFRTSWDAYAQGQASAAANVSAPASSLDAAISVVNTGATATNIYAAQIVAGDVSADMSTLLNLTGLVGQTSLLSLIQECNATSVSYWGSLQTAGTWNGAYSQATLSGFSNYLGAGTTDYASAQSGGSAYESDCQAVIGSLAGYLTVLGVQAIYDNLTSLQISASVSGVDSSLQQETNAMATVQDGISSLTTAVTNGEAAILVTGDLLAAASSVSTQGGAYLNATVKASLGQVSAYASATAQAAQSFVASAQTCLQASIGTYSSTVASLSTSGTSLSAQTQASVSATATAVAYVQSDSQVRAAAVASGQADVAQALQLFSTQNVSAGVAAMAQASLEFQAASGTST